MQTLLVCLLSCATAVCAAAPIKMAATQTLTRKDGERHVLLKYAVFEL